MRKSLVWAALVVASVAVFFSLGGVGLARKALTLIDGHQIKKGTIEANRLSKSAQKLLRGRTGSRGPRGIRGPAGLSTGPAGGDLRGTYPNPTIANGAITSTKLAVGSIDTPHFAPTAKAPNSSALGGVGPDGFWQVGGNAGLSSPVLGTTDNQTVTFQVNGQQALQLQPDTTSGGLSPNLIGGYSGNSITAGKHGSTIAGGGQPGSGQANTVTQDFGVVSGGYANTASGSSAAVVGGRSNIASGDFATAGGNSSTASGDDSTTFGHNNIASGPYSTALGISNTALGADSTASGGANAATGPSSTALGGNNTASGQGATALGLLNTASGDQSTAIGNQNQAPGTTAFAIGGNSTAGGTNSFAGGSGGVVRGPTVPADDNTFLWSDGSGGTGAFTSSGSNQFDVRSIGGVTFQTNNGGTYSTGCKLPAGGGAWSCTSDRHAKHAFRAISLSSILRAINSLAISSWSYKTDPAHTRHIGPVAQDFLHAFRVGGDPRSIGVLDEGGVALAGVKGLINRVDRQQAEIAQLRREVALLIHRKR